MDAERFEIDPRPRKAARQGRGDWGERWFSRISALSLVFVAMLVAGVVLHATAPWTGLRPRAADLERGVLVEPGPLRLVAARGGEDGSAAKYLCELVAVVRNRTGRTVAVVEADLAFRTTDGAEISRPRRVSLVEHNEGALHGDPDNFARFSPLEADGEVRVTVGTFSLPAAIDGRPVSFGDIRAALEVRSVLVE